MGTSSFQVGTPVSIDKKPYVIERKIDDSLWQLKETKTGRIAEFTQAQLEQLYVDDTLRFEETRPILNSNASAKSNSAMVESDGMAFVDYSQDEWAQAKIKRAYVVAIENFPNTEAVIQEKIDLVWEQLQQPPIKPNWTTVFRWKMKFIKANRDATIFISNQKKRGNRESRYPTEVLDIVEIAIDTVYMIREKGTIQDAIDRAKILVIKENALRVEGFKLPEPTRQLVKRMITDIPAFDRCVAREGRDAAANKFRNSLSHRITARPLDRAEIDHTPLPIIVIDDESGLPLGRPYFSACIDDFSRNFLGIHVSFVPPSYLTVARCLKSAFLPKVDLKKDYPEIENEWEAHGVMRTLVVDNGTEFHGESLQNACLSLGITIEYSPRKKAWYKGKIERALGTLNNSMAHGVPGTAFQNIFEKGDYDPVKHAVIRYSTLQLIIRKWIVDLYHQRKHRTLGAPPAIVWRANIQPEDINLPNNLPYLDAILSRSEERKLTHKGIELDGLLYNSEELGRLRQKEGQILDVEIRINDDDIGSIIVLSPDKKTLYQVQALRQDYAKGLSSYQHKICKKFAQEKYPESEYDPSGWLTAKYDIAQIIEKEFQFGNPNTTRKKIARLVGDKHLLNQSTTPLLGHIATETAMIASSNCDLVSGISDIALPEIASEITPLSLRKKIVPIVRDRQVISPFSLNPTTNPTLTAEDESHG